MASGLPLCLTSVQTSRHKNRLASQRGLRCHAYGQGSLDRIPQEQSAIIGQLRDRQLEIGDIYDNTIRAADYTNMPGFNNTGGMSGKPPPDMASWLLDRRIVFCGLPIVDQVTEILIAEFLWLNYMMPKEPIYLLLCTIGNQDVPTGTVVASERVSFAAYDTMMYIKPQKRTFVIGGVSSTGVLLAAGGEKGYRYGFPEAAIVVSPPRINRTPFEASDALTEARELMKTDREYFDILAKHTGKDREVLRREFRHNGYLHVDEAIQWGILDKVGKKGLKIGGLSASEAMVPKSATPQRGGGDIAPAADA